jgi:glycosyltransferase involved in cell wall biosynthesis
LALADDTLLVGALGNVRKPKAYDLFLRAARLLRDHSSNYRFAIAGEASGNLFTELLALRHDLGLDEVVTFLGLRSDVVEFLRSIDVYVLSSTTEGFSIACIEAMAAGAPVVSTRCGGPEEILEHEDTGLLVPVQDPAALAGAVRRIVENRTFADTLRKHALQRVSERYALGAMVHSYEKLFEDSARR